MAYLSVGFAGLKQFTHANDESSAISTQRPSSAMKTTLGYGPLLPDKKRILDLPKGFSYKILAQKGETMSDGLFFPASCDGMAAFPGKNGEVILVINHENGSSSPAKSGAFGKNNELLDENIIKKLYDTGTESPMLGGTTTLVYDPKNKKVLKTYLSLGGTERNCAGGPTPWNSWITCEETDNIRTGGNWKADHGYNFEVSATSDMKLQKAKPIKAMGRFRHEAVAVDPVTSIVYQTEDIDDGAFYRFVPNIKNDLHSGGKLQALAIIGHHKCDTRNYSENFTLQEDKYYDLKWIDLEDVESPNNDLRLQAQSKGAALFARGEGIWNGQNQVYFACTNGGKIKQGQIFCYHPSPFEGSLKENEYPARLELFVESKDAAILSYADNLTVASWGDIIIAEDTYTRFAKLVGITPKGHCYDLARHAYSKSELAGACFSPDFKTLFVNIQKKGLTLAIEGPWENRV